MFKYSGMLKFKKTYLPFLILFFIGLVLLAVYYFYPLFIRQAPKQAGDREIYRIKSPQGNIFGIVGITFTGPNSLTAIYHLRVDEDLPDNWVCKPSLGTCPRAVEYSYALSLGSEKDGELHDLGTLSAVYCNLDNIIQDPFERFSGYYAASCGLEQVSSQTETRSFYWNGSLQFNDVSIMKNTNLISLYDASDNWIIQHEQGNTITHTIDSEKAIRTHNPFKTYKLIYYQ